MSDGVPGVACAIADAKKNDQFQFTHQGQIRSR